MAREGFQRIRGGIPLHLDKVSAQMGPFGAHLGPFLFCNFPKTHFGPKWLQVHNPKRGFGALGPRLGGACGPWRPKADFSEGCGGAEPPHCNAGGVVGRQPPHRKGTLGAIANSEIRNPVEVIGTHEVF